MTKNKKHARLITNDQIIPTEDCCQPIRLNKIVFVDSKFGSNETGVIESVGQPVRTIDRAFQLVKENRADNRERWNVIIRPGDYPISKPVPNNVVITGVGNSSVVVGALVIRGEATFASFKLLGTRLPIIDVQTKQKYPHASIIFAGLDIEFSKDIEDTKNDIRVAVQLNSNAFNSVNIFSNCQFFLNYTFFEQLKENKVILITKTITNIFAGYFEITANLDSQLTVINNLTGVLDIDLGKITVQTTSTKLKYPVIYYDSSSDDGISIIKSNRTNFFTLEDQKISTGKWDCSSKIPLGVIQYLGRNTAQINSIDCVPLLSEKLPIENRYTAFAASKKTIIDLQNLQPTNAFPGKIAGIPSIKDITKNIKYFIVSRGNTYQSGSSTQDLTLVKTNIYKVKRTDSYLRTLKDKQELVIVFPDPNSKKLSLVDSGWTVTVDVFKNTKFIIPSLGEFILDKGNRIVLVLKQKQNKKPQWKKTILPIELCSS